MRAYGSRQSARGSPASAGRFCSGSVGRQAARLFQGGRIDQSSISVEEPLCAHCRSAQLYRTACDAIGQVDGVGLHTPLKVEILQCERCDYAEFTGNWSIVQDCEPRAAGAKSWEN